MRGKCATCEFYEPDSTWFHMKANQPGLNDESSHGDCHIRSVEKWPPRAGSEGCGEHMPQSIHADPPDPTDDLNVHEGERVGKSLERVEEPS